MSGVGPFATVYGTLAGPPRTNPGRRLRRGDGPSGPSAIANAPLERPQDSPMRKRLVLLLILVAPGASPFFAARWPWDTVRPEAPFRWRPPLPARPGPGGVLPRPGPDGFRFVRIGDAGVLVEDPATTEASNAQVARRLPGYDPRAGRSD